MCRRVAASDVNISSISGNKTDGREGGGDSSVLACGCT